jgi:hypothetical protein
MEVLILKQSKNMLKIKEVNKSQEFLLKPTKEQEKILYQTFGIERYMFNFLKGLDDFTYKYHCYGNSIDCNS